MERVYELAIKKLGMSQEEFDGIVFSSPDLEEKVIDCLEYCFGNVGTLEMISCVLLQYIAERHTELFSQKEDESGEMRKENDEQKYIDNSENSDIIYMDGSESRGDSSPAFAYAIAKEMGVDTTGMTPKEVFEIINKKGGSVSSKKSGKRGKTGERKKTEKATKPKAEKGATDTIVSATAAERDHILGEGVSKKAQDAYDTARKNEKNITKDCVSIASEIGVQMSGLDFSVKTASSVADKIERAKKEDRENGVPERSDEEIVSDMWDIVRYTGIGAHNDLVKHTVDVMDQFEKNGYQIVECVNKYTIPNTTYKGIHLAVKSPDGQMFEYQVHSEESLKVKNINHKLYEEARNVRTSPERRAYLEAEMKKNTESVPMPKDIETLVTFRDGRRGR